MTGAPRVRLRHSAKISQVRVERDARRHSLTYNIVGERRRKNVGSGGTEARKNHRQNSRQPSLRGKWRARVPMSVAEPGHAIQGEPAVSSTPRKARRSRQTLRLWSFDQAQAAVPYL